MSRVNKKYAARQLILQELFQNEYVGNHTLDNVRAGFVAESDIGDYDKKYYAKIIKGIRSMMPSLDEKLIEFIDRDIASLNKVELCILRLGIYEMLYCDDVPFKVVIDQATKLAKDYGTGSGYKYVNGVLDNIAAQHRKLEYLASQQKK